MDLEFLNQLNENDYINLLNYVHMRKEQQKETPSTVVPTSRVELYNSFDRRDEFGNQEVFAIAWNANYHIGNYTIKDFSMTNCATFSQENFDKELREYMTSIFGEEYLTALKNYYVKLGEDEAKRISDLMGVQR